MGHTFSHGKGNPHGGQLARFRSEVLEATTPEQVREVWERVVGEAKRGASWACTLFLAYVFGKPKETVDFHGSWAPPPEMTEEDEAVAARIASSRLGRPYVQEGDA